LGYEYVEIDGFGIAFWKITEQILQVFKTKLNGGTDGKLWEDSLIKLYS
jgi:hypothetical protein